MLGTLLNLIGLLQQKNASLARLKRMLFGPRSDSRPGQQAGAESSTSQEQTSSASAPETEDSPHSHARSRKLGHGRLKSSAYRGAKVVHCRDSRLRSGDRCPDSLCSGHLYDTGSPAILVRPLPDEMTQQMDALLTRRRQLVQMLAAERNHLVSAALRVRKSVKAHIA